MLESRVFKSYTIGEEKSAPVGEAFLVDQNGTVVKQKVWVGLLYSPNGWKVTEEYSTDFIRKELIYAGKAGNIIEISYREFRGGLAAPAFFQNLKYDVAQSREIRFQKFIIEIIRADNQTITYKIIHD